MEILDGRRGALLSAGELRNRMQPLSVSETRRLLWFFLTSGKYGSSWLEIPDR